MPVEPDSQRPSRRSFACSSVDEPQFAGISHKDVVATPFEHSANPGRVGSGLDRDAQGLLGGEAPLEGFGAGAQPTLLYNLAAFGVDEAQVGVLVAEI